MKKSAKGLLNHKYIRLAGTLSIGLTINVSNPASHQIKTNEIPNMDTKKHCQNRCFGMT